MSFALTKEEIVKEVIKSGKDPNYFINNYCKISHPMKGLIPFKTYEFQADLLKKSEQLPTDQEQFMLLEHIASQVENIQKEMETMRNNNVNINYAMKDIEKIKESLESVKDKVRANGSH